MPNAAGWSLMAAAGDDSYKYLIVPSGSKNFTMFFPEWVTAFSYKVVGNKWYNWMDVGGSAISVHKDWGFGKALTDYIYNDSGWKMNVNLGSTATKDWGKVNVTVEKYHGGSFNNKIGEEVLNMSKYYLPVAVEQSGYDFVGYYSAKNLENGLVLITAESTVYALFGREDLTSTIYIQTIQDVSFRLYAYDTYCGKEVQLNNWPGVTLTDCTDDTGFNGSHGIIKATFTHITNSVKIILNNGSDENKSDSLVVTNGAYYYATDDSKLYNGVTINANMGAQAAVVHAINKTIMATEHKSTCEVSKSNAASLVALYDALDEENRGLVDAAVFYSWTSDSYAGKENYTYDKVVEELREISNKEVPAPFASFETNRVQSTTIICVIIAVALASCVAGSLLIFKRKEK